MCGFHMAFICGHQKGESGQVVVVRCVRWGTRRGYVFCLGGSRMSVGADRITSVPEIGTVRTGGVWRGSFVAGDRHGSNCARVVQDDVRVSGAIAGGVRKIDPLVIELDGVERLGDARRSLVSRRRDGVRRCGDDPCTHARVYRVWSWS